MSKMSRAEAGRLGAFASIGAHAERRRSQHAAYASAPSLCKCCGGELPYDKRTKPYCSRSCAARINGSLFPKRQKTQANLEAAEMRAQAAQVRLDVRNAALAAGNRGHATMKNYLLSLFGNKCMDPECAWDFEACAIDVELDHIDGDSTNNVPVNLRLLCPNCHGLTDTFAGKNRGKSTRGYRTQRYAEGKSF